MPALAVADETFSEVAHITIPGAPLHSFDISWVDSSLHSYLLADRTHAQVDVLDTGAVHTFRAIGAGAFIGDTGNSDTSGPNGVLTITQPGNPNNSNSHGAPQVWAGDGPHPANCPNGPDCKSTVKIFDFASGNLVNVVSTGGTARADELCYDPRDHLVMIANDADTPPFVTFISTEGNNKVLGKISIPESNGGIEQCQWNPRNGMIYLNIPSTTDDSNGKVYVIDPRHETIVAKHDATDGCQPTGMALGPAPQILLGCGGPDALVMNDDGSILSVITGQGGEDEVWYNPGDGHYSLAESNNTIQKQLGIVDSSNESIDQDIKTGTSSHSVAADPVSNQIYLPVRDNGGGSPTLCGDTNGCIAIFGTGNQDADDVPRNTN